MMPQGNNPHVPKAGHKDKIVVMIGQIITEVTTAVAAETTVVVEAEAVAVAVTVVGAVAADQEETKNL